MKEQKVRKCNKNNELLNKIIEGDPVLIVFTPSLRRALRKRMWERGQEEYNTLGWKKLLYK